MTWSRAEGSIVQTGSAARRSERSASGRAISASRRARQGRADARAEGPVARQGVLEPETGRVHVGEAETADLEAAFLEDRLVGGMLARLIVGAGIEPGGILGEAAEEGVDVRRGTAAGGDPDPPRTLQARALPVEAVGDGSQASPGCHRSRRGRDR